MAYRRKLDKDIRCPLEYGLDVFGGKWKSRILCVLSDGQLRYSELRNEMADVTDAALAIALKDLGRQRPDRAPAVRRDSSARGIPGLTDKGRSVIPVLQHICQWSGLYYKEDAGGADVRLSRCQRCDYRG